MASASPTCRNSRPRSLGGRSRSGPRSTQVARDIAPPPRYQRCQPASTHTSEKPGLWAMIRPRPSATRTEALLCRFRSAQRLDARAIRRPARGAACRPTGFADPGPHHRVVAAAIAGPMLRRPHGHHRGPSRTASPLLQARHLMNRRAQQWSCPVSPSLAVVDSGFVRAQPCRDLLAETILVSPRPRPSGADPATHRSTLWPLVIGWGADEFR
jgi:hypothetical protein